MINGLTAAILSLICGQACPSSLADHRLKTLDVGDIRALVGGFGWVLEIEFPKGSNHTYGQCGSAFACVRGTDTIAPAWTGERVSTGEAFTFGTIRESSSLKTSQYYDPAARAVQQIYAVTYDTGLVERPGVDPIDLRPAISIGLEIHATSYAWSDGFAKRFILVDTWFKNISGQTLQSAVLLQSGDVLRFVGPCWPPRWGSCGGVPPEQAGDICGLLQTVPGIVPSTLDTMNLAWSAGNDGDPDSNGYTFTKASETAVLGVRILRVPTGGRFSYNWWTQDPPSFWSAAERTWGPRLAENKFVYGGFVGAPEGSRGTYRIATNGEVDYDQMYSAIDYRPYGWAAPPSDPRWTRDIAGGTTAYYMLSYGPLPDIAPGDSVPFTVAVIAGADFHRSPRNFAENFDPADPRKYRAGLDFSDLITNARWADWVFDNPGVDTDHDGNRGRAYLVNCDAVDTVRVDTVITGANPPETTLVPVTLASGCDSVFYKGDGVPDFRGPQAPPPPVFQLTSIPGKVILRWNGAFTELERDPMTRKRDFEGYKVYAGRLDQDDQYSLIASWDRGDFKRFAYRADSNDWRQISDPLPPEQWRQILNDPGFDPLNYATASLTGAYPDSALDTTRNVRGDIIWIGYRERYSYWLPQDYNRTNQYVENGRVEDNPIQQVKVRDTVIDNKVLT